MFAQTKCRNTALVGSGQINSPEPLDQRQIGRVENRSRSGACLMMTLAALVSVPRDDKTGFPARAFRTNKSIRPSTL